MPVLLVRNGGNRYNCRGEKKKMSCKCLLMVDSSGHGGVGDFFIQNSFSVKLFRSGERIT